jgi:hypothetical protein
METEKTPLYSALGCLKFFLAMPFVIGLIFNWDGLQILMSYKRYKDGILKINSYNIATGSDGTGSSLLYGIGKVDSIHTYIKLEEDSGNSDSIPVWYKPDGKLTVLKYPNESEFPFWRIFWKLFFYIMLLNGPFIGLWVWQLRLKRKLKLEKNEE